MKSLKKAKLLKFEEIQFFTRNKFQFIKADDENEFFLIEKIF